MARIIFPDANLANEDGLLAIGGNLEPDTLINAYSSGIFPWSVNPISWWSPDPRAVFSIEDFKISRRLQRIFVSGKFSFSIDKCFVEVMKGCARPAPGRESSWISPQFIKAYTRLHQMGIAHSVEAWYDGQLAGGVYGVAIGGFFAGESMFHEVTNGSTLSLNYLMQHLKERGFELFDSQVASPHTFRLGATEICRGEYLKLLRKALAKNCCF